MLQRPQDDESANLLISTHEARESDIQNMISTLQNLEFVNSKPIMIRIV